VFDTVSHLYSSLLFSNKYLTIIEVTDSDKPSSLLRYRVNCGRKKFYSTGPQRLTAIFSLPTSLSLSLTHTHTHVLSLSLSLSIYLSIYLYIVLSLSLFLSFSSLSPPLSLSLSLEFLLSNHLSD